MSNWYVLTQFKWCLMTMNSLSCSEAVLRVSNQTFCSINNAASVYPMEDLIVGVGQIGRASARGVSLHSLIRDPRHVKSRSPGCLLCSHLPNAFGQELHRNTAISYTAIAFPVGHNRAGRGKGSSIWKQV